MKVHQSLTDQKRQTLGVVGYGAFGRFAAQHLALHFDVCAHDALQSPQEGPGCSDCSDLRELDRF